MKVSRPLLSCPVPGCDEVFTRKDTVERHLLTRKHHTAATTTAAQGGHECALCGNNYIRKDHLLQHLRQFHRMKTKCSTAKVEAVFCLHDACLLSVNNTFISTKDLYSHIRKLHGETPFQCPVLGCSKVGAQGWFRSSDRAVHQRKAHPEMEHTFLDVLNETIDAIKPAYLAGYK